MAKFSSLTLMNGDKVISENDVVTTTKNGLMTPEMYNSLVDAVTKKNTIEVGTGNILGGYGVKAKSYNSTTHVLTLEDSSDSSIAPKMSKFTVGSMVYFSDVSEDFSDSQENEYWGTYRTGVISSVNSTNKTITFAGDVGLSSSADFEKMIVMVDDPKRKDSAFSSGDRNFVTGQSASADGLFNTVSGIGSKASGAMNFVSGHFSNAEGVNNTITGDRNFTQGGNNKIVADMAFVVGNGNTVEKTGQGAIVFGGGNMDVTGVDTKIFGDGNKATANRVNIIGFHNNVSGQESSALGNALIVKAKKAVLIGQRGELPDTHENKGAIGFAGGDSEEGTKVVSFIHRTHKTDPYNSDSSEICYTTEYRGRLKPMEFIYSSIGNFVLDHDQYARWIFTGTGAITLTLENWQDGDIGEIVIDSSKQTFTVPNSWIMPDSLWDELVGNPDTYCLEIRQIGSKVFVYNAVSFSMGNITSNVVGGLKRVITSSNVTAQSGSWYLCSGNITVTLPASSSSGDVVKVSSVLTANNVSIVPSGTDTIESQTGFNIDSTNSSVELIYNGSMWIVAEVVVN